MKGKEFKKNEYDYIQMFHDDDFVNKEMGARFLSDMYGTRQEDGDLERAVYYRVYALHFSGEILDDYYCMGMYKSMLGDYLEAVGYLEIFLRMVEENSDGTESDAKRLKAKAGKAYQVLGYVWYELEMYEESEGAIKKSLEIDAKSKDTKRLYDMLQTKKEEN